MTRPEKPQRRRKRDFEKFPTPQPRKRRGKKPSSAGPSVYVLQLGETMLDVFWYEHMAKAALEMRGPNQGYRVLKARLILEPES